MCGNIWLQETEISINKVSMMAAMLIYSRTG